MSGSGLLGGRVDELVPIVVGGLLEPLVKPAGGCGVGRGHGHALAVDIEGAPGSRSVVAPIEVSRDRGRVPIDASDLNVEGVVSRGPTPP